MGHGSRTRDWERSDLLLILDSIDQPMVVADATGSIQWSNPSADALFGQCVGRGLLDLVAEPARSQASAHFDSVASEEAGTTAEFTLEFPSGLDADDPSQVITTRLRRVEGAESADLTVIATFEWVALQPTEPSATDGQNLAIVGAVASRLGHQISNSIASIKNVGAILRASPAADHPDLQFLDIMDREADRATRAVRQFLETRDPDRALCETLSLSTAVEDAIAQASDDALGSSVSIECAPIDPEMSVSLPPGLLTETVYLMVRDAVEASSPGGEVKIVTGLEGRNLEVRFERTRPGATPSTGPPPDSRHPEVNDGRRESGLRVAEWIASAMGGTIEYEHRGATGVPTRLRVPIR